MFRYSFIKVLSILLGYSI